MFVSISSNNRERSVANGFTKEGEKKKDLSDLNLELQAHPVLHESCDVA